VGPSVAAQALSPVGIVIECEGVRILRLHPQATLRLFHEAIGVAVFIN
jgi:hypothetical protein